MATMRHVREIGDVLEPNECTFSLFTVILPLAFPNDDDGLISLIEPLQDLSRRFEFEGCGFAFRGGGRIFQGDYEAKIVEWEKILDDDVYEFTVDH